MNVYVLIILFWYRISNSYRNVPKQPHLTLLLVLLSSQFSLLCNGDDVLFEKSVWFSEKVSICDISSVKPRGCYYDDLVTWRINLKSINIQGPLPACMLFSCSWLLICLCVLRTYLKVRASHEGILIWTLGKMTWCLTRLPKPGVKLVVNFSFLFCLKKTKQNKKRQLDV